MKGFRDLISFFSQEKISKGSTESKRCLKANSWVQPRSILFIGRLVTISGLQTNPPNQTRLRSHTR